MVSLSAPEGGMISPLDVVRWSGISNRRGSRVLPFNLAPSSKIRLASSYLLREMSQRGDSGKKLDNGK